jgi:hypothetical protein
VVPAPLRCTVAVNTTVAPGSDGVPSEVTAVAVFFGGEAGNALLP